ncbi:Cysteine protease [Arachis hypogaea]|nr:Cysteine protease [Arachis hypogaea]
MVLKSICERIIGATCSSKSSVETIDNSQVPASLKVGSGESKYPNASLWSGFFPSGFLVSETHSEPLSSEKKAVYFGNSGWAAACGSVNSAR